MQTIKKIKDFVLKPKVSLPIGESKDLIPKPKPGVLPIEIKSEILVFFIYVLIRLPNLGYDLFNTDVWKWKARIFNFGQGVFTLNFIETVQRYHPGVTLMWLGTFAVKINNFIYDDLLGIPTLESASNLNYVFRLHFLQKLVITLALGITISFLYFLSKKLVNETFAKFFVFFLVFEPFYAALTRVIHLEGLLSTFMFASVLSFIVYLEFTENKNKYFVLSAFFAALSFLTKSPALVLLPLFGLYLLLGHKQSFSVFIKKSCKSYFIWLLLFLSFVFLFWPALWVDPILVFNTLKRGVLDTGIDEGHGQFYFGRFVEDPGGTFYFVVLLVRSSPYLLLGIIGAFLKRRELFKNHSKVGLFVLLFVIFYWIEMSIPSKKLDRYLLPSIVGLVFLSSFFYSHLYLKYLQKFKHYLLLFFVPLILINLYVHPDYLSYYNTLTGGLRTGIYIIEPKWMIGQKQIKQKLLELKQQNNLQDMNQPFEKIINTDDVQDKLIVGFPEKYYTQIWPFVSEIGGEATIKDITAQAKSSKYFVYPVWDNTAVEENRFELEKIDEVKLRGVTLYYIYERID